MADEWGEIRERLLRLEEVAGHADHRSEQVSGEVTAIVERVEQLARRMAALEQRIKMLEEPPMEVHQDAPPDGRNR